MIPSAHESINRFLIENFNFILRAEERALSHYRDALLSVTEFHVLEAVSLGQEESRNTMGEIARKLGITMGSLTTAVKTLEKKGCLLRLRSSPDRRIVRLELTEKGKSANQYHQAFHTAMVSAVAQGLSPEQLAVLTRSLELLSAYFSRAGSAGFSFPLEENTKAAPDALPPDPGKEDAIYG